MTAIIGSVLISLLVLGGGLVQAGYVVTGLALIALGSTSFGVLFAAVHGSAAPTRGLGDGIETPGLTLAQLVRYVVENDINTNIPIYVGADGLHVAAGVFNCVLDGRPALVIERKDT